MSGNERKTRILHKLCHNFTNYKQVIRVTLINISTRQITNARKLLREMGGTLIVGKDSLTRLAIRILTRTVKNPENYQEYIDKYPERPDLKNIYHSLKGKFALIFADQSYVELKPKIEAERIKMAAKAGIIAPNDVWIRKGPTGIDPGKIGDFHRLNIQVKTARSSIEVTKDYKLCAKDEIVSETVSGMCRLLNIIPFEYGMELEWVLSEGQLIPKDIIELKDDQILANLSKNVGWVTALSVEANIPNSLSVPHFVVNSFKYLLAVGLEGEYEFKQLKEAQENQAKATEEAANQEGDKKEDAAEEEAEEEEEEEEEDSSVSMGGMMDMFG